MKSPSARKGYIDAIGVPFMYNGDEFIAYDDEESIKIKV